MTNEGAPIDTGNDAPDCIACGACCFSTLRRYVPVSGDDYARLADHAERLVTWNENQAFLRLEDGHCAALAIERATGRFLCTVYESRPQVCRDLGRGSPECEGERALKADRPLIALRRRD
jgi:Fe-S-cluster containining protein